MRLCVPRAGALGAPQNAQCEAVHAETFAPLATSPTAPRAESLRAESGRVLDPERPVSHR